MQEAYCRFEDPTGDFGVWRAQELGKGESSK